MTTPKDADAGKKNIVIVDDDTDLLRMLIFAFKAEGYPVIGFENGKDATEYLINEKNVEGICLLILDRLLPDMDGIEILKTYAQKFDKHVPVMFLSVLSGERDVITGLKEGAVEYVTKPFSLPILMEKATNLITRFST